MDAWFVESLVLHSFNLYANSQQARFPSNSWWYRSGFPLRNFGIAISLDYFFLHFFLFYMALLFSCCPGFMTTFFRRCFFFRGGCLHDDTGVGSDTLLSSLVFCRSFWRRVRWMGNTYGPQLSSLLSNGASDGGTLHLTLGVDDLYRR